MFRVECVSCGHNVDLILLRKLRLDSYLYLKIPFVHSLWLGCTHSSLKKWQWTTLLRSIFYYILLASIKYVGHFTASLCFPRAPHTHWYWHCFISCLCEFIQAVSHSLRHRLFESHSTVCYHNYHRYYRSFGLWVSFLGIQVQDDFHQAGWECWTYPHATIHAFCVLVGLVSNRRMTSSRLRHQVGQEVRIASTNPLCQTAPFNLPDWNNAPSNVI